MVSHSDSLAFFVTWSELQSWQGLWHFSCISCPCRQMLGQQLNSVHVTSFYNHYMSSSSQSQKLTHTVNSTINKYSHCELHCAYFIEVPDTPKCTQIHSSVHRHQEGNKQGSHSCEHAHNSSSINPTEPYIHTIQPHLTVTTIYPCHRQQPVNTVHCLWWESYGTQAHTIWTDSTIQQLVAQNNKHYRSSIIPFRLGGKFPVNKSTLLCSACKMETRERVEKQLTVSVQSDFLKLRHATLKRFFASTSLE
jgi:hypothetical protein